MIRGPSTPRPRRRSAFTLIELMVVIVVIALIVALAFPSLLRSRMAANESNTIGLIRAWITGAEQYRTDHGVYPMPIDAESADPPYVVIPPGTDFTPECCLGGALTECPSIVYGYKWLLYPKGVYPSNPPETPGYDLYAWPAALGKTGTRCFYADESGVIRAGILPPFDDCELIRFFDEFIEDQFRRLPPLGDENTPRPPAGGGAAGA